MITQENRQLLSEMKNTNYGKALKNFLDDKYEEMNNVATCKSWEETLGRAFAVKILDDLFSFMKEKTESKNKTRYD